MHNGFPYKKFVKVKVGNIIWEDTIDLDWGLPENLQEYEVVVDEDVDPTERWCEDGSQSGYEALCEALTNQLSDEYDFRIIYIDDVEVID
jgi:hypothetical protein